MTKEEFMQLKPGDLYFRKPERLRMFLSATVAGNDEDRVHIEFIDVDFKMSRRAFWQMSPWLVYDRAQAKTRSP